MAAVSKPHSAQFMVVSLFFGVGFGRFYGRCSLDGARPLIDSPILRLLVFICFFSAAIQFRPNVVDFPRHRRSKKTNKQSNKTETDSIESDERPPWISCALLPSCVFFCGSFPHSGSLSHRVRFSCFSPKMAPFFLLRPPVLQSSVAKGAVK